MISLGELIDKACGEQEVKVIVTGSGEVRGEAEVLIDVLRDEVTDMTVTGIEVDDGCLKLWVEAEA